MELVVHPVYFLNPIFYMMCAGSYAGRRVLITISDDSDEEPVTLVPGSPVLVSDDDDVSILEVTSRSVKKH